MSAFDPNMATGVPPPNMCTDSSSPLGSSSGSATAAAAAVSSTTTAPNIQTLPPQGIANLAVFPSPRPNPKCYVHMSTSKGYSYFHALTMDETEAVERARHAGQHSVGIGHGKTLRSLDFQPVPDMPGTCINATADCYEYYPRWFFLNNEQHWSAMAPKMNAALSAAIDRGEPEVFDGERSYNVQTFNQTNRESGRRRPIMCMRDDGSAVRGDAVSMWAYVGVSRGAPKTIPVPFQDAEALDKALQEGRPSCNIAFRTEDPGHPKVSFTVTFSSGGASSRHDAEGKREEEPHADSSTRRYVFMRCFPTWFYLGNDMHWAPLDFATTQRLDEAAAMGLFSMREGIEREYDLCAVTQRNLKSGMVRPLVQVRGLPGNAPGSDITGHQRFPEVFARANKVVQKITKEQAKAIINDSKSSDVDKVLALCNVLVHQLNFVIKGGILRDAVVKNDISKSHDIDIELPNVFKPEQLMKWASKFLADLESNYNVKKDPAAVGELKTRNPPDCFGEGLGRQTISKGIVVLPIILPGDLAMDLECVTPWNSAYSPPRNVDVSINNLRVTSDTTELMQNVPIYTGHKTARCTITVNQIIDQILRNKASPVYDFEWQAGSGAETGEGRDEQQWCVGAHPTQPSRAVLMNNRFKKMREKGYKFEQMPRTL